MKLKGKKIALFAADLYEDLEFWYPFYRMDDEVPFVGEAICHENLS